MCTLRTGKNMQAIMHMYMDQANMIENHEPPKYSIREQPYQAVGSILCLRTIHACAVFRHQLAQV